MTVRYESEWVSDNRRNMHSTPDSIEAPRDYAPAILDILGALRSMLSLFVRGATVGLWWGYGGTMGVPQCGKGQWSYSIENSEEPENRGNRHGMAANAACCLPESNVT